METKKKRGMFYMVLGALVLLVALAVYVARDDSTTSEQPTATTTEPIATSVATTTDIFAMEPIVPEAKVSTEGWKTCRNEEYGWEVMYPGEWYVWGADSEKAYGRAVSPSGNCVGIGVGISNNIDPGDKERKQFGVTLRSNFLFPHPFTKPEERPATFKLSELKNDYLANDVKFGYAQVSGQSAIYTRSQSNSLLGGYTNSIFFDSPHEGVVVSHFTNISPDIRDTILSTLQFSTSTGELDHGKLLNAE